MKIKIKETQMSPKEESMIKFSMPNLKQGLVIPLLILTFLIPLFFGISKLNILDFNKQILMIFLLFPCLILWFFNNISEGKLELYFDPMHLIALALVFITAASTLFSRWTWGSLWGWPQNSSDNLLTISCFFIFYILFSYLINKKKIHIPYILLTFSGALVAIIGILQLLGKFIFPMAITKITSFNTIGTVNSWALFLSSIIPLSLAFFTQTDKWKKTIFGIITLILLSGVVFANYWLAWIGLLIGISVFLTLNLWKSQKANYKFLTIPTILFSLAIIFGGLKVSIPGLPITPIEVSPSFQATFDIVKQMIKSSPVDFLLGWGPGTFKYGWSKFKAPSLNQTIFWNIRFSNGKAQILKLLSSTGLLGALAYIGLIVFGFYRGIKILSRLSKEESDKMLLIFGIISSFFAVSSLKFLNPSNLSLNYIWWILLAGITVIGLKKPKTFQLETDSKVSFILSFFGIILLIGTVFVLYLEGARCFAESKYAQMLEASSFEEGKELLLQAIRLSPQQEIFWQSLANLYLFEAEQEISNPETSTEEKTQRVGNLVANAVAASKQATEINPVNVANWQTRGMVYREIIGWSQGSFEWAVNSYEKAYELEPNNPFILTELARTYLAKATITTDDAERKSSLEKSKEYIMQAINLKSDYAQAIYQLSLVYEMQGERAQAISTLEQLKAMAPFLVDYNPMQDIGLAFQLGLLYYSNENYSSAQGEFERAVSLDPNYTNARYFLGLSYDETGRKTQAIEQFELIEEYNPENEQVKQILTNLRNNEPALQGIAADETSVPIENEPEEQ